MKIYINKIINMLQQPIRYSYCKLLNYDVLRSTQHPTLSGMGNELQLTGYKVKA